MTKNQIQVGHFAVLINDKLKSRPPIGHGMLVVAKGKRIKLRKDENSEWYLLADPKAVVRTFQNREEADTVAAYAKEVHKLAQSQVEQATLERDRLTMDALSKLPAPPEREPKICGTCGHPEGYCGQC